MQDTGKSCEHFGGALSQLFQSEVNHSILIVGFCQTVDPLKQYHILRLCAGNMNCLILCEIAVLQHSAVIEAVPVDGYHQGKHKGAHQHPEKGKMPQGLAAEGAEEILRKHRNSPPNFSGTTGLWEKKLPKNVLAATASVVVVINCFSWPGCVMTSGTHIVVKFIIVRISACSVTACRVSLGIQ